MMKVTQEQVMTTEPAEICRGAAAVPIRVEQKSQMHRFWPRIDHASELKNRAPSFIVTFMSAIRESRPPQRGADKRAILRDHYLFAKLTPMQIDRLSNCIVSKSVKRGTAICAKGDPGTCLFAIAPAR